MFTKKRLMHPKYMQSHGGRERPTMLASNGTNSDNGPIVFGSTVETRYIGKLYQHGAS